MAALFLKQPEMPDARALEIATLLGPTERQQELEAAAKMLESAQRAAQSVVRHILASLIVPGMPEGRGAVSLSEDELAQYILRLADNAHTPPTS